jgi:protein SCO1/2
VNARSYRLGLSIVAGTILISGLLAASATLPAAPALPASRDLTGHEFALGTYRLTERSGRTITEADLEPSVWIASFIFTRCPNSCPRISATMKGLQGQLEGTGVKLVSISVDPEHDTPEVLARYASTFSADPDRWWFLTGPTDDVYNLILKGFRLGVQASEEADRKEGAEAVSHSDRLALVNVGNKVIGTFPASDAEALRDLVVRARKLDNPEEVRVFPPWVRRLPAINATLNGTCAVLLVVAWLLIRAGRWRGHAICMTGAVAVSTVFLACYLVYHFQVGSVKFQGVGPIRTAYFTILLSHTVLATLGVVPLVSMTLIRAIQRRFDQHARIAAVTFPIWLYVSVTGVVIYWMLYQMPISPGL